MERELVIEKARSYIKYEPYYCPNIFTKWYWGNDLEHAWCGAFVKYIIKKECGLNYLDDCSNIAYVPTIVSWAKSKGWYDTNYKNAKMGDLVIFNWTPGKTCYSHVGLVISVGEIGLNTIEGNTSFGNYTNNMVVDKARNKKYICGVVHIPYKEEEPTTPPTIPPTEPPKKDYIEYVVIKGDNLTKIANKYGTTWQKLAEYNQLANPNLIYVGQIIKIPNNQEEYYTVIKGDNLTKIAKRYGTTVNQLVEWNGIANPNLIKVGQVLRVR